jgi:hypothetical protein
LFILKSKQLFHVIRRRFGGKTLVEAGGYPEHYQEARAILRARLMLALPACIHPDLIPIPIQNCTSAIVYPTGKQAAFLLRTPVQYDARFTGIVHPWRN